jgi:hypothetical protein
MFRFHRAWGLFFFATKGAEKFLNIVSIVASERAEVRVPMMIRPSLAFLVSNEAASAMKIKRR